MEVRQRPRPTGQQWFETNDLARYLEAFGDDPPPLPETMRVLDVIAVDYIIETCYEAEAHARYAGRQKVKVDDFQFALRNDTKKLGRVQEMLEKEKGLKLARKAFDLPEGAVQKNIGEDGEVKTKGKRGRKKRVSGEDADALEDSPQKGKKRRKSGAENAFATEGIGEDDVDLEDENDE
ncbi:uncharacterized protein PV09_03903 [Verruconis gallopava]|uniref:Transcription initiation factor TFIID subunit 13 n=1 Tax=Verruconis gallopava TaxID=253628 RepID=A0A0D2AEG3_9PEZI|nr:uncharacterized protein PV09_03903 [Verruconis gallopava]KIW05388.1 hypothetical protein PV09_03903 [Verruconis gallopava]